MSLTWILPGEFGAVLFVLFKERFKIWQGAVVSNRVSTIRMWNLLVIPKASIFVHRALHMKMFPSKSPTNGATRLETLREPLVVASVISALGKTMLAPALPTKWLVAVSRR